MDSCYIDFLRLLTRGIPWFLAMGGAALLFLPAVSGTTRRNRYLRYGAGSILILLAVASLLLRPVRPGVVWTAWEPGLVEKSAAAHQPVVLDFFAEWCLPCHDLEHETYSHPKVIAALESWTRIKVDLTDMESPPSKEMIRRYGLEGLPAIVFLNAAGQEIPDSRVDGFIAPLELVMHVEALEGLKGGSSSGAESPAQ